MACPSEHHGDVVLISGADHLVIAHRAAGLDDCRRARFDRDQQAVRKWEERIGGDHGAARQRLRQPGRLSGVLGLAGCDPGQS